MGGEELKFSTRSMNAIKIESTSRQSAIGNPIILRQNKHFRLVFIPMLVDNPRNKKASVKGFLVFQRKGVNEVWENYKTIDLSQLRKGEGIKLELHSEELYTLITSLEGYYRIYEEYGIPHGEKEFLVTPKNVRNILEQLLKNPKNLQYLAELNIEDLNKLGIASWLQSLEKAYKVWKENQENSSEKFWQDFFKKHPWVVAYAFAVPIVIYGDSVYVGGTTIDRSGGKLLDFLFKYRLTSNILLVEIKTPTTLLLEREYRQGIYPLSRELKGAITQVLTYKDELYKSYSSLLRPLNNDRRFEIFNPHCLIIAGNVEEEINTDMNKKRSFELIRNGYNGIDILGFDELFLKLEILIKLIKN